MGRSTLAKLDTLMKNNILKTKLQMVKSFVFPVEMYRCESWAIKEQERKRIDAFELWCSAEYLEYLGPCKSLQILYKSN